MKLPDVQIKKILYATDLSESAVHAFAYAASLADKYGAGITILHVFARAPRRRVYIEHDRQRHLERDQDGVIIPKPGKY